MLRGGSEGEEGRRRGGGGNEGEEGKRKGGESEEKRRKRLKEGKGNHVAILYNVLINAHLVKPSF